MDSKRPWYYADRAEQLATVMLTRHPRLTVDRPAKNYGFDLLVTLLNNGLAELMFGVEVKADLKKSALLDPELVVRKAVSKRITARAAVLTFPIAIMLFDMSDDTGYLGWILQPRLKNERASLSVADRVKTTKIESDTIVH